MLDDLENIPELHIAHFIRISARCHSEIHLHNTMTIASDSTTVCFFVIENIMLNIEWTFSAKNYIVHEGNKNRIDDDTHTNGLFASNIHVESVKSAANLCATANVVKDPFNYSESNKKKSQNPKTHFEIMLFFFYIAWSAL